ncbi:sll0787 family AIR synthase-like protein [Bradyrhizobium guangzhouense]|uniref:Sll0787 family AIR synthase-like protein n=1 Tax=Bradyrhizobium guangzhouense TaxID=1325095 RepID=A0ABY0E4B6_9BRAD|nr:sll0787 family AIR synthase-like protein [Bradyrhizobium guangzhouense]RXH11847.1 sll0787 family AIR synthase-like protein [Bradyrhizobium guangzhouense]
MLTNAALAGLAETLRKSRGIAAKADIAAVAAALDLSGSDAIAVGDDCAAIPEGDGYTLFAIEGFMNEFVAADPWFAGWCGAMVNISDVAAMGGRPTAIVNAIWSNGADKAAPILEGLKAAARTFGVPVIGGHTNVRSSQSQFAVAILGRASRLLTSFDARPGDKLIAAIDLRGRYRDPFANWEAATDAPAERLRGDLEILPSIAEAGLALAAKDISQGGIVGTAAMLAECSQVAITLDVEAVPIPAGAPLERWLLTFPSFGYLLSAKPDDVDEILSRFQRRGIAAAAIGDVSAGTSVDISAGSRRATVWDFAAQPLIGCAPGQGYRQRSVA